MDEVIKPCPFCGNDGSGPIEHALHVSHTQNDWHSAYDCYSVQCDKCTVSMGYSDNEAEAIAAWNTRADAAPTPKADEVVAVARAICVAGGFDPDEIMPNDGPRWHYYTDGALAAIAALDAARGKAEPVAWMYHHPSHPKRRPPASVGFTRFEGPLGDGWIETPLYAHPPAPDAARGDPVARLIAHMKTIEPDEETAGCPATWADFIQILEGIAEAGEPFNG